MRLLPAHSILVLTLCWISKASASYVPLTEVENPNVPAIPPDRVINLAQHGNPGDVVLSTDGRYLVYSETILVFDIWAMIVSLWPEFTLVLFSLIAVYVLYKRIRKRIRLPIENGPFCRKCAYPIHGLSAHCCPECGQELKEKSIALGVTRSYMTVGVVSVLLLVFTVCLTYAFADPPRDIGARHWVSWHSEKYGPWAHQHSRAFISNHVRNATAMRSFEITSPNAIKKIVHVINNDEFDQGVRIVTTAGWIGYEDMDTSFDQTHAGITTPSKFALIDLKTLRLKHQGEVTGVVQSWNLSSDGSIRLDHREYGALRGLIIEELNGSGDQVRPSSTHETVLIPLRVRSTYRNWSANPQGGYQYEDGEILIRTYVSNQETYFEVRNKADGRLSCSVQAGYLVVMASNRVLLYDLISKKWVLELDIAGLNQPNYVPDGLGIALSADRSTAAYLNSDGSSVAIYSLPEISKK